MANHWVLFSCSFFFGDDDPDLTSTLAGPIYFFSPPPYAPFSLPVRAILGGWVGGGGIGAKVEIGNGALKQKWTWRNWFLSFFLFGIARHWVVPLPAELSQRERGKKEEEGDLHFGS